MCLKASELWASRKKTDERNTKVMSTAAECDLSIHTNDPGCRSVPGGHTQTLAVVGSAVWFALPAASYLHWGIHKGN